jgi:hypothetical protein
VRLGWWFQRERDPITPNSMSAAKNSSSNIGIDKPAGIAAS